MTKCTSCVKYKLLLTCSTFSFQGEEGLKTSIHFHLCKNKKLITELTPDMGSTHSSLKEGRNMSPGQESQREVYPNKTNHPPPPKKKKKKKEKTFSFFISHCCILNHPHHHPYCIFLFKETYCFHLLPLCSRGE